MHWRWFCFLLFIFPSWLVMSGELILLSHLCLVFKSATFPSKITLNFSNVQSGQATKIRPFCKNFKIWGQIPVSKNRHCSSLCDHLTGFHVSWCCRITWQQNTRNYQKSNGVSASAPLHRAVLTARVLWPLVYSFQTASSRSGPRGCRGEFWPCDVEPRSRPVGTARRYSVFTRYFITPQLSSRWSF